MKSENIQLDKIATICKTHHVMELFLFGSALTEKFNSESDIDLAVNFKLTEISNYADNYFALKDSLQKILHRSVDLIEMQSIKNPYFKQSLDTSKQIIYGSGN